MTEINATHDGWAVCHDGINVIHVVTLNAGNKLATGQPYVEQFDDADETMHRIREIARGMRMTDEDIDAIISQNFGG